MGNVAAAEDVDYACLDKFFAVVEVLTALGQSGFGSKAGDDISGYLKPHKAAFLAVDGQPPGMSPGDVGDKPGLFSLGIEGEDLFGQGKIPGISCGDVLKIDVYISAADHTQVFNLVFAELEVFHAGAFLAENGLGQLLAPVFYGSASDGPGYGAVIGDEHAGSGSPGGRSGAGYNGDQNGILVLGQRGMQGLEQVFHGGSSLVFPCTLKVVLGDLGSRSVWRFHGAPGNGQSRIGRQ